MKTYSHVLETTDGHKLRLFEFTPDSPKLPKQAILFVHGVLEDSKVFYTETGRGLIPFLVKKGYHCYALDGRSKGDSKPALSRQINHGHEEILALDFPLVFDFLVEKFPSQRFHVISHSWGGVLMNSFLLRADQYRPLVRSCVHLASKRRVRVFNLHRIFYIDLMWLILGTIISKVFGYLPPGYFGPEGESRRSLQDSHRWVYRNPWRDELFDYEALAKTVELPETLYMTGLKDMCMGHYKDVQDFAEESGHPRSEVKLLSKKNGYAEDYDHISILTSKKAPSDHFVEIANFLSLYTN